METRKQYVERRVAEMQDKYEKSGITDYDFADMYQTAEEEYDLECSNFWDQDDSDKEFKNETADDLLEELLSGKIGPDEFEQDGVGNRK